METISNFLFVHITGVAYTILALIAADLILGTWLLVKSYRAAKKHRIEYPAASLSEGWYYKLVESRMYFFMEVATLGGRREQTPKRRFLYVHHRGLKVYVDAFPRSQCDNLWNLCFWWTFFATGVAYLYEQLTKKAGPVCRD